MLLEGFLITVLLSVIAIIGGTILGMIVAVGYTGKNPAGNSDNLCRNLPRITITFTVVYRLFWYGISGI